MTSNIAPSAYTPQNYRHLQDLVAQTNNLKHTDKASTKSWIQTAQTHWNQSKMAKEIGALDKAYEEFLMALEIIVNMIPACHDWPTISMSKTPVKQQYEALRMNLKNNTTEYDKIKQIIKQDNKLSGILATAEHLKNKDMINQSNSAVPLVCDG
ncbi:hypothetical protein EDC01DRAFT_341094 [Geopyxis carbonaria]|nr:hypothetical protein EDC01DRAFT_341094 [Geopyxis carbonaria]